MSRGKTITIYLADGSASGLRHAELDNWTGQAVVCPRTRIGELKTWAESQRPGTYILFGTDADTGRQLAYIGEADNVLGRLQDHLKNKEFWQEVVMFTSKDLNLTKSHVRYLESRLVALATTAKRYRLLNGTVPQGSSLPRREQDAMEEFIDHVRPLLAALGHRILEPLVSPPPSLNSSATTMNSPTSQIETAASSGVILHFSPGGVSATGRSTDEGFVVLKGSLAAQVETQKCPPFIASKRLELKTSGILVERPGGLEFTDDVLFTSPSAAAATVAGGSRSGPESWRTPDGTTLKDLEQAFSILVPLVEASLPTQSSLNATLVDQTGDVWGQANGTLEPAPEIG